MKTYTLALLWLVSGFGFAAETTYIIPHFTFREGAWVTRLALHNPSLLPCQLEITAHDQAGLELRTTSFTVASSATLSGRIDVLLPDLEAERGWLEITADSDQLRGIMQFTAVASGGSTTLPLMREASPNLVFTSLRNDGQWASGFAIVNLSDDTVTVEAVLLNSHGNQVVNTSFELAQGAKRVAMVSDLFPIWPEEATLRLQSTGPLAGFALSAQNDASQLIAVPAEHWSPGHGQAELADRLSAFLEGMVAETPNIHGMLLGVTGPNHEIFLGAGMADPVEAEPMTAEHPFRLASVGKTMTATLVMQLEEEGLLSIEQPVADVLPADILDGLHIFEGVDHGGVMTVRQLLSHTSGLGDHLFDGDDNGDGIPDLFFRLMTQTDETWDAQKILAYAREHTVSVARPGEVYHYSDLGYVLLALVVEQLTGQSFHEAVRVRIFEPLEMTSSWTEFREEPRGPLPLSHTFLDIIDYTDFASVSMDWGGGGQACSPRDLNTFYWALIKGELFENEDTFARMADLESGTPEDGYGLGIGTMTVPGAGTFVGHNGFSGAIMYYWVERDMVITGTANQVVWDELAYLGEIARILDGRANAGGAR